MYIRLKKCALIIALVILTISLCGCGTEGGQPKAEPTAEPVTLTVAGGWTDFRALDMIAKSFSAKYPNCNIVYEYLQGEYFESLEKRINSQTVDMFLSGNLQDGSQMLPYALDLYNNDTLDLSNTFDGLIQNYIYRGSTDGKTHLYSISFGAELRGMYVNKTLLNKFGIEVPTNRETLLAACEKLKEQGYIPLQGNPSTFAQWLTYPWVCNDIANAADPKAMFDIVNAREPGISELFRPQMEFIYTLVENGYYDYKKAQTELNMFVNSNDIDYARYFLNIWQDGDEWKKTDDIGQIAFMPATMSMGSVIARAKSDYHSEIEYEFMLAPMDDDGGYAYLSPAHGIAICNNSPNTEWSLKFLDFLFQPENNESFAQTFGVIPNTREAFSYITQLFDVPESHISQLGQVTFDYSLYDKIMPIMVDVSKANNPKYMQDDGNGNVSLYPLDFYMSELEKSFQEK